MRVLLINPFYPISETPSPPLGLAYLAAALEAAAIEVEILDLVVFPYSRNRLEALLQRFQPHIAGITSVTMTFKHAVKIIKDIKCLNSDIFTVMGGPHVSFCASDTLRNHRELDFVVQGEGERTLVELTRALEKGHGWHSVKGIVYRQGSEIRYTGAQRFIQNLDSLAPPARHLLPLRRYRTLGMPISMTTSRGCPYKCIFCVGRKMVGARVRYRSPQQVVDELENLATLDFHQINIADDLFTAKKKHCLAVCDEIIKRNLKITWTSFARVDTVSEDLLEKMKAAGCNAVSFGIESGNEQILKTIKKGITKSQVVAAVEMCNRTGIVPYASFILGLPGETPETLIETLEFGEFLKKMGLSYGFHLLAPFPGTEVRRQRHKFNIRILTNDWSQYHANRAIVETPSVKRQFLDDIVVKWENEYNELLADIKRRMQTGRARPDEARQVQNLERIVLIYDLMMNNVVEEKGSGCYKGSRLSAKKALQMLSERIYGFTKAGPEELHEILYDAMQQGNLQYLHRDGKVQWRWVNEL